jgi:hypothetical protein
MGVSTQGGVMGPLKISEYQKSIKFEFVRAQMAQEQFMKLAGYKYSQLSQNQNHKAPTIIKLQYFDTYARWCGHVYEVIKALAIIDQSLSVDEESNASEFDSIIQKEVEKLIATAVAKPGIIHPSLKSSFSSDLRKVRNKCSFHCTNKRVKTDILSAFMKQHHQEIYFVYNLLATKSELLGVESINDFGAIEEFYSINWSDE